MASPSSSMAEKSSWPRGRAESTPSQGCDDDDDGIPGAENSAEERNDHDEIEEYSEKKLPRGGGRGTDESWPTDDEYKTSKEELLARGPSGIARLLHPLNNTLHTLGSWLSLLR
ncbi:hypothetical protein MTO96_041955 [Rhipicephalus appendiculatus]